MKQVGIHWILFCVSSIAVLLYWNASKLVGAPPRPRMSDMTFAPSATTLRLMSLGHTNTIAKLRWIDSFSYLQYQFEKRDDTLMGEQKFSGFDRLYSALIELDPKFMPFYDFAMAAEAVVDKEGNLALRCIHRGLLEYPNSTHLWRNLAAHIKNMSEHYNPAVLDSILSAWSSRAETEQDRLGVELWRKNLGEYQLGGLEQLDHWCRSLLDYKKDSLLYELAEETLLKQLNNNALKILQKLYDNNLLARGQVQDCLAVEAWQRTYAQRNGMPGFELSTVELMWGPFEFEPSIEDVLRQARQARQRTVFIQPQRILLRNDPYGLPYRVENGIIVSDGAKRKKFEHQVKIWNFQLDGLVKEKKRWPQDVQDALSWLDIKPEQLHAQASLKWKDNAMTWSWSDQGKLKPWPLKEWATFWISLQELN